VVPVAAVRAVQIWVLARSEEAIKNHSDTSTYVVGDKHITAGDKFRRRLLTGMVKCRNLGL
jgi:hypothetical protein